ncbi:unnamed protein product [Cyprideis torosa]|uniref:Uncharacterized protein n=1 Tax=Cyprideis torosa TaxID=163714 RepID=A0A7R8W356_9CRUS|nr:unnamed protein product [Cyprideis torosa]CAG0882660.1 unnamed protein product [Cyprideis torosa]
MKQDDAQPHLQNGSSSSDIIADASTTEQKSVSSATCAKASDEERNAKLKEKAAVQSLGMLEYENQMFLEILEEDALVVTGRGMCLHRVLTALFACYSDPGNLVLILGTNQLEQEYFINQMRLRGVEHLPRVITADQTVAERSIIYLEGGVIFVTARILVLDLLKDQIPTDLITGVIPEVVEIGVVQSEDMMVIQTALLDLLTKTISELKNGNRGLGLEELAADEMLVPTFRKRLASITDPVIHQLSPRSKQQLRDISTLATLASALIQYDCVTFLTLVESVGSTERLMRTGGWIFHPSAETLFVTVRNRVLKPGGKSLSDKKYIKDLIELPLHPKWKVLSEVVEDILKSYPATSVDKEPPPSSEQASCSAGKETKPVVLLLAREERTCLQLQEVLADGPTSVFKRILQTQADVALNSSESGLFVVRCHPLVGKGELIGCQETPVLSSSMKGSGRKVLRNRFDLRKK